MQRARKKVLNSSNPYTDPASHSQYKVLFVGENNGEPEH